MSTGNPLMGAEKKMAALLASGGRVVIGSNEPIEEGFTLGRDGERHLAVKRRATRQEFIDCASATNAEERAQVEAIRAPFYYELELWDRVLERPDGERLGVRIREVRKAGA